MNSEKHRTLIKFREVEQDDKFLFLYPALEYCTTFDVEDDDKADVIADCTQIDKDNVKILYSEILKYNEELRLLWQRAEMFNSEV